MTKGNKEVGVHKSSHEKARDEESKRKAKQLNNLMGKANRGIKKPPKPKSRSPLENPSSAFESNITTFPKNNRLNTGTFISPTGKIDSSTKVNSQKPLNNLIKPTGRIK